MATRKRTFAEKPVRAVVGELPGFVSEALESRGLTDAYARRPLAQRDHYVRRILRAVRAATAEKRLEQMLSELEGDLYMKRPWRPRALRTAR